MHHAVARGLDASNCARYLGAAHIAGLAREGKLRSLSTGGAYRKRIWEDGRRGPGWDGQGPGKMVLLTAPWVMSARGERVGGHRGCAW